MGVASVGFGAVGGQIQAIGGGDMVCQIFTTSASSQSTTATTTANKPVVRLSSDVALYVSFGTAPNATSDTNRFYFPAGGTEYFIIGADLKVALVNA